ncbi:MAG: NAD(P)-dependent alcohol dehydrogenase [Saprospiraceae bacterium]|nr:NAD(P)-dependent alcohol dehydrogenase [Saprospiraceae bacterium]
MKAVVYKKYGTPDVLELADIPKPAPKANEVLIKIHATSVTAGDWRLRKADPFLARLFNGLFKPRRVNVLGFELAGVVEEVGEKVQSFKKGDPVFASCGLRFGGYAEYTCLPANDLMAIKPANMTFEEAATVPIGGLTAWRFLNQSGIKAGDQVLIYGASGSVGTFAIQIAKALGAEVTAVCSTTNVDLVKRLGADVVIDYTREDFTGTPARFDIIFDAVGKTSKSVCGHLLKPGGKYTTVAKNPKSKPGDLEQLKRLIEAGQLISVIDRTYTLERIREAHTYVESFRKKGNVAVSIVPAHTTGHLD